MLTGKQVRVRYARERIIPSYLDAAAPEWQEIAERLLVLFRQQEDRTRGELEEDVKETFGSDPQTLIHQGLAKLLEDRCEFEVVSGHPPEQLRELVFAAAARQRAGLAPLSPRGRGVGGEGAAPAVMPDGNPSPPTPLPQGEMGAGRATPLPQEETGEDLRHPFDRAAVLRHVADELKMTPDAVDVGLFADLKSEQRLVKFDDITAERLLQRYNVALAQAVLLRSIGVSVLIRGEPAQRYRQLVRSIKFHRLIADWEKTGADSYRLKLDGPLSLFSATQKYGLQLALFLPSLLLCHDFELEATLRWGTDKREKLFKLTPRDGLVSHVPETGTYVPPELAMFTQLFRKRIADWEIVEEADVLPLGTGFWVPDFRLVQKRTGKFVYLEVLGFWRRSSAEAHLARLKQHASAPFLLAVSDQLHIEDAALEGLPAGIHRFKQMPLPDEIVRLAEEKATDQHR